MRGIRVIGARMSFIRAFSFRVGRILAFPAYLFDRYRPSRGPALSNRRGAAGQPRQAFRRESVRVTLPLCFKKLSWVEARLRKMNGKLVGEDRPGPTGKRFFQRTPLALLSADAITSEVVAQAMGDLVRSTSGNIGRWSIPFRKPRVEFNLFKLKGEPAHIEFGDETLVVIHPSYAMDRFALAAVLCHELAHFVIDHNDMRERDAEEGERITDLFVFRSGLGMIRLQGILSVVNLDQQVFRRKLGYLDLETMAYAHARCAAQHGVPIGEIDLCLVGEVKDNVGRMIDFLAPKGTLTEVLICPSGHLLLVPRDHEGATVKCRKCGWEDRFWLCKQGHRSSLMREGVSEFDAGRVQAALLLFREAQDIDGLHSEAYCWAARSLESLGRRDDAVREVRKLLMKRPEDANARTEMKRLLKL
jgi:tetratricopeptide (TPR) repeat protein